MAVFRFVTVCVCVCEWVFSVFVYLCMHACLHAVYACTYGCMHADHMITNQVAVLMTTTVCMCACIHADYDMYPGIHNLYLPISLRETLASPWSSCFILRKPRWGRLWENENSSCFLPYRKRCVLVPTIRITNTEKKCISAVFQKRHVSKQKDNTHTWI